ncbi:MAG: fimbrillin family protein [Candidatus Cryptobacteroides sp.]
MGIRLLKCLGGFASALCLASCQSVSLPAVASNEDKVPVCLCGTICQENVTRADANGFADGDVIATYIVDYEDGQPGLLKDRGNRADNLFYTFNEPGYRWVPAYDVYYRDDRTPVDIYAYYPSSYPESVTAYHFRVASDQNSVDASGLSGYEQSDFLWAKAENKTAADKVVRLDFYHRMAGIRVTLVEGSGFADGEWAATSKDILVRNTVRDARINLSDGSVIPDGQPSYEGIIPLADGEAFRAVVVPQVVKAGSTLITATVGGCPYNLDRQADMTYSSGKLHNFTLTVNKRSAGDYEVSFAQGSITDWENDGFSHEGAAKEYVVVNVETPGTIDAVISASGLQLTKVRNLKVTGTINSRDFEVMNSRMVNLSSLNLKEAVIAADNNNPADRIPPGAFSQKYSLISIVLPDRLKTIGAGAFNSTNITGSLIIPEGVETLEDACFSGCSSLNGQLSLPSTLKHIGTSTDKNEGDGAFVGCNFVCNLNLPEGLETIGSGAFCRCRNIYGEIDIPETVTSINYRSFAFMDGVRGTLRIPQQIEMIPEDCFCDSGFNGSLVLHDGILIIERSAFNGTGLKGELHLPKNLEVVNNDAFRNCDFSGALVFPASLARIGDRAFENNTRLIGMLEIPEGVLSIGTKAFYNCMMLDGIIFPESLESILDSEGGAFENCFNIGRIVCRGRIPPLVNDVSFNGVAKDNFVLEVPEGSEQQYRAAKGWSSFKRIASSRNIALSRMAVSALNSPVSRSVTLFAEGPWRVGSCPSWVTCDATEGSGKTDLVITFSSKPHDGNNRFGKIVFTLDSGDYATSLEVAQYDCSTPEDVPVQLRKATSGKGIDVVILCDGFSAEEVSLGKTLQWASEAADNLLSIPPFSTFGDRFNVWTAASVSDDSGVNSLNTAIDTRFGCLASDGNVVCSDKASLLEYVRTVFGFDQERLARTLVILLPNTYDYEGSADFASDCLGIACCPMSASAYPMDFRGMVQYWAGGRVFGRLADESVRSNSFFTSSGEVLNMQSIGWYRNVSISGKASDTSWGDFVRHPSYSSFVDVFEGAMGSSRGIFRSEQNSCMGSRIPYYNTISRYELMRRILECSGEEFSMDFFLENDRF